MQGKDNELDGGQSWKVRCWQIQYPAVSPTYDTHGECQSVVENVPPCV